MGYALIAVLIGLATLILVYLAQGYGYDPAKGVSQSSLVFFGAKPGPANIYIDGEKKDQTDTRLTIGEGTHKVMLKKDKYRDWTKTLNVEGGSVMYVQYPRLFPANIPLGITKTFTGSPLWASQSLDRHWLLIQPKAQDPSLVLVDLLKPQTDSTSIQIPSTLLSSDKNGYGRFEPVEWSDDNKHVLLRQVLDSGKKSYIVLNIDVPAETLNLTDQLKLSDNFTITLRDKAYDKYYAFNSSANNLQRADLKNGLQADAILTGVIAYKSHGDDVVIYISYDGAEASKASVRILSGSDKYTLQPVKRDDQNKYLLDVAKYDGNWYYTAGSKSENKVILYRNPLSKASPNNTTPISPRLALVINSPQFVSFSDTARFIAVQSGKQFVVFDAELSRVYRYESEMNIAQEMQARWMDGHRLSVIADGKAYVFDFDGTNTQQLVNSRQQFNLYFDRDYKYVYSLIQQADGNTGLQNGQIVL